MLTRIFMSTAVLLLAACSSSTDQPLQSNGPVEQAPAQDQTPAQDQASAQGHQGQASAQGQAPAQDQTLVEAQLGDSVPNKVVTTASGLQYEILKAAEGSKPTKDSVVTVHYAGSLTDGTEFDSSYSRGEPSTFLLANVIQGWIEGVQLMSVGSKYRFIIPSDLAYGDQSRGEFIKPGDTLVFEVELLEINSN